jgi:hypothetical protein
MDRSLETTAQPTLWRNSFRGMHLERPRNVTTEWGSVKLGDLGTKRLIDALRYYLLAEIAHSGEAGASNSNTLLYINVFTSTSGTSR